MSDVHASIALFVDGVQIMTDTHKVPQIKLACHAQNRLSDLQNLSAGLEKCQKSLNDYLDAKRNAFPRFFFISDDELLSILGSSDPECVQEHMIKVWNETAWQLSLHILWLAFNCCPVQFNEAAIRTVLH